MAPPPSGIIFGPIKDWGKGSCKLLLDFCSEEGVKGRRQYILEDVTGWVGIPEFGERGVKALEQAVSNTEQARENWQGEGDWCRAVKLLDRAIAIQDGAANGQLDGYEVDYQTALSEDGMLESITVRPTKATGGAIFGMAHHWTLTTPKGKSNGTKGEPAKWVARLEEVNEEGDFDYENMRKKGKRRKVGPLEAKPLEVLGQELGVDLIEPAIPRGLEDVRANVFRITLPAWNLGESQGEWSMEKLHAPGDWAEEMEEGLEQSSNRIPPTDLSAEEVVELAEELVEGHGQDKVEEDQEMEEEDEDSGGEDRCSSWKRIHEPRRKMEVVEAIRENAEVLEELAELKKEERGLEGELKEVREQLALLAVSMGAGTVEDQAKVQRTISARKGRVEEEKRKEKELKKVEAKRKEAEADKKKERKAQEEAEKVAAQAKAVRDSQQKAWVACEEVLEELARKDRTALNDDELIGLGKKMKEARAMKERIERETRQPLEARVGKSRQVVNGEILKTVEVVMGHKQEITTKGKAELEAAVAKVNLLLRTTAVTEDRTAWVVMAKAGTGEFGDESTWSVCRVAQDIDPLKVAREVEIMLIQVFGRTGVILNVWVEEGVAVRLIVPSVPMPAARDRRALAEKLRGENKNIKGGKRMPKAWGEARVTGFTFDAADAAEATMLVKTGIMWDGKRRKVALFGQGEASQEAFRKEGTPLGPRSGRPAQQTCQQGPVQQTRQQGPAQQTYQQGPAQGAEEEVDVAFVGEAWIDREGKESQRHPTFVLGSSVRKGRRVLVYWQKSLMDDIRVILEEDNLVVVRVSGKKLGGVYASGKWQGRKWEEWLAGVGQKLGGGGEDMVVVEDWNAHSQAWDVTREEDSRGRTMADWLIGNGWSIAGRDSGWTWERMRRGRIERSRIDLFLSKEKEWEGVRKEKLASDHWALLSDILWEDSRESRVLMKRKVVNWESLEREVDEVMEAGAEAEEKWVGGLEGMTPYEKLRSLGSRHTKFLSITERSKKWWDSELSAQLKITRRCRRERLGDDLNQNDRVIRWKTEKEKLRALVRRKKKECWQKFCEENGEKDPWEVVKWAKDPWHIRGTMGKLVDEEGKECQGDEEKAASLVADHFKWREDGRQVEDAERGQVEDAECGQVEDAERGQAE
ncbi:hypothetical protein L211DRAFT_846604 [Terfezia boudieri ATCC MYA-4762]|uniref:Endonuclease/exonuclease/phosphatase domain-containing protein n=1 Tax=Terfezia boudieri ATCC MYA-4762 TaxID=1051890 RepID=A0A3N4LVW6_9PEZI|nr:hypothetical protein L211DRAFT_846604 [Terfezia boudieri ATCC MYA-4762]